MTSFGLKISKYLQLNTFLCSYKWTTQKFYILVRMKCVRCFYLSTVGEILSPIISIPNLFPIFQLLKRIQNFSTLFCWESLGKDSLLSFIFFWRHNRQNHNFCFEFGLSQLSHNPFNWNQLPYFFLETHLHLQTRNKLTFVQRYKKVIN